MSNDDLSWLEGWYSNYCRTFLKNIYIKFDTVDNPGLCLTVNLKNTFLENAEFVNVHFQEHNEDNWTICHVRDRKFEGVCGPRNLPQMLGIFRKWVEEYQMPLATGLGTSIEKETSRNLTSVGDDFLWLQNWYCYYCDGDWEHSYGFDIYTTDLPGWHVTIDLETSELENCLFDEVDVHGIDEGDWLHCEVNDNKFEGSCGPQKVSQVLSIFRKWAEGLGQKVDTEKTNFQDHFYMDPLYIVPDTLYTKCLESDLKHGKFTLDDRELFGGAFYYKNPQDERLLNSLSPGEIIIEVPKEAFISFTKIESQGKDCWKSTSPLVRAFVRPYKTS